LSTHAFLQVHDIIQLSSPCRSGIYEKIVEFSGQGMSPRWIARELKVSKSFVTGALAASKKELQRRSEGTRSPGKCATRTRGGRTPFGFDYLESKLVENPRELHAVQKIIELWNSGGGPTAIARKMNRLKLKTRNGKQWDHSVVSDIIVRAQDKSGVYARLCAGLRPYKPRKSPSRRAVQDAALPKLKKSSETKAKNLYNTKENL
jgi:hypothetical protein